MISEHARKHGTVYQIQCETQNKGKRVASSKRRIRWRFGFANVPAMEAGMVGKDCRGAEHEVVFVWSLNSGKQLILADGHEVHWAKIGRKEKLEVAWDMRNGNHKLKVVAEPAKSRKSSDSSQFDLLIDGISFCDLPGIYELGTTPQVATTAAAAAAAGTLKTRSIRQESRSYSLPDLLSIPHQPHTQQTPPPKIVVQQHSPTSSIDLTVFDNGVEVHLRQQQMPPPQPQQQRHYQRSHSVSSPQRTPQAAPQAYNYAWNDATALPTPQQTCHSRNSWQAQTAYQQHQQQLQATYNYSFAESPQKRGSIGSHASSDASSNPFQTLNGYSTPTRSVSYDSDLNDSPLSQALKSLGIAVDDDRSVTSNLSVASNPFDFVQPSVRTYLPTLMVPQPQQPGGLY